MGSDSRSFALGALAGAFVVGLAFALAVFLLGTGGGERVSAGGSPSGGSSGGPAETNAPISDEYAERTARAIARLSAEVASLRQEVRRLGGGPALPPAPVTGAAGPRGAPGGATATADDGIDVTATGPAFGESDPATPTPAEAAASAELAALARAGTPQSARALLDRLRAADDEQARLEVLYALAELALDGIPEARDVLAGVYGRSGDAHVRAAALYSLYASFPDDGVRDLARRALGEASEPELLVTAANALAALGDTDGVAAVRAAAARTVHAQTRQELTYTADVLEQLAAARAAAEAGGRR